MREYDKHLSWSRLGDSEQQLVHLLFASQGSFQTLPCRDAKMSSALVVAAESWADEQPILVVGADTELGRWSELWEEIGEKAVEGRQVLGSKSVNFAGADEAADSLYRLPCYGVVLLVGNLGADEANRLTKLLSYERVWWVARPDLAIDWPRNAITDWLLAGLHPELAAVNPGVLLRPSALAERVFSAC